MYKTYSFFNKKAIILMTSIPVVYLEGCGSLTLERGEKVSCVSNACLWRWITVKQMKKVSCMKIGIVILSLLLAFCSGTKENDWMNNWTIFIRALYSRKKIIKKHKTKPTWFLLSSVNPLGSTGCACTLNSELMGQRSRWLFQGSR